MNRYETIPHTADVRLKVEADSYEEIFRGALLGTSGIIKSNFCAHADFCDFREEISISSVDRSALLIDFLNETIALSDENKAVFCKIDFLALNDSNLEAILYGQSGVVFDKQIKAATYHAALIGTNDKGNLEVEVLFDI